MATHKLIFDEDMEEPYILVAIHCSEESYKLAFLLNQYLKMRFRRKKREVDFSAQGQLVTFPLYEFEDQKNYTHYYLVNNQCKVIGAALQSSGGLFAETVSEKATTHYLLPEFKKVDYFLKIYADLGSISIAALVSEINRIKQVISAYLIEDEKIKSKNNLIFD